MQVNQRGFTLIELLVVIAIIGVLAAILIPNVLSAIQAAKQTGDTTNLKRLAEALLAGQASARSKPIPNSPGTNFWLALVVGDGPGGLEISDEDDPDIYLGVGDAAGLLISPGDGNAMSKDEVKAALVAAIDSGSGVGGLSDSLRMCSYAGPVDPRQNVRDRKSPIIGCTHGGVFPDGFSSVSTGAEAVFRLYRDMTDAYNWPEGATDPLYGQAPLEFVVE